MPASYPPLGIAVDTPRLTLRAATDELLEALLPAVRKGVIDPDSSPFDDPMSLYLDSPEREWRWLRSIWAGRARLTPEFWRLYFVVWVQDEPAGMQDLIGVDFANFATVSTFSWLRPEFRGRGLGAEMRAAVLHLAFDGLSAAEASSDAFVDNAASNGVSQRLGYQRNGIEWATRRGESAQLQRWRLTRAGWNEHRRADIHLTGVQACLPVLGL